MSDLTSETQNVPSALEPGQTFGENFLIKDLLGKGGMASVYRAHDRLLERDTALKLLDPTLAADPSSRERFRVEAKTTTRLNHPNIAKLYSYGEEDGQLYMAMELIEGSSLAELLQERKQIDSETFQAIFTGVIEALSYAHREGVIHRDLKPSNIMLTADDDGKPQPKIVDFGLAKMISRTDQANTLTVKGSLVGSPLYMSPEQCKGIELDARSDIYSLACVMYECLAGKPPFSGESAYETMYEHVTRSVPQFDELSGPIRVPRAVALVIIKALSKERDNRQQSVDQLRQELEAAFDDKRVYSKHHRKRKRGPAAAWVACIAIPFAIAGYTALSLNSTRNNSIPPTGSTDKPARSLATGARSCYNQAMTLLRESAVLPQAPDRSARQSEAHLRAIEYLLKASDACEKAGNNDTQLLFEIEMQLGYMDQEDSKWDSSIKHLNKALKLFPSKDSPGYWNQLQASTALAQSYKAMKQHPKALETFTGAISHYEAHAGPVELLSDSYYELANCYLTVKDQKKALQTFRRALNAGLRSASGWGSYSSVRAAGEVARLEFTLVSTDAAGKTLKTAELETDKSEVNSDSAMRYALLANTSLACGFTENAERLYRKAEALVDRIVNDPVMRERYHKEYKDAIQAAQKQMARAKPRKTSL